MRAGFVKFGSMPAWPFVDLCKLNCLTNSCASGPFLSQASNFLFIVDCESCSIWKKWALLASKGKAVQEKNKKNSNKKLTFEKEQLELSFFLIKALLEHKFYYFKIYYYVKVVLTLAMTFQCISSGHIGDGTWRIALECFFLCLHMMQNEKKWGTARGYCTAPAVRGLPQVW